jgi:hypothetical protein
MQNLTKSSPTKCPTCGSTHLTPIMYGYPSPKALTNAEEGRVILGGCVVYNDSPTWKCNGCGRSFRPAQS